MSWQEDHMALSIEKEYPGIGPVIAAFADWWRARRQQMQAWRELSALEHEELARTAQDAGVSIPELCELAVHGPEAADLLHRRMAALHIDETALAKSERAVLRDLERLCTTCREHRRCARDLARRPDDPVWQHYCPNATTLRSLAPEEAQA
jgi:hypothetical protein